MLHISDTWAAPNFETEVMLYSIALSLRKEKTTSRRPSNKPLVASHLSTSARHHRARGADLDLVGRTTQGHQV